MMLKHCPILRIDDSAPSKARRLRSARRGFALVTTLTLMILLTVLAVGLLSLSAISLRTSSQSADEQAARANARMALMLALGDLQKHAGADTRVTARADILDEAHPPVLGVWKSWQGDDRDDKGRPVSPGNYRQAKEQRFLGWLTSADAGAAPSPTKPPAVTKASGRVPLLGDASVGSGPEREKLQVHLAPSKIQASGRNGGLAWWVSGENQKARLPKPYEADEDRAGRWAISQKSHATADPKPFGMESLLTDPAPAQLAISLGLSDLIESDLPQRASQEFFHDLSTNSVGLLTNTATGGWRKDLSLVTENWDQLPLSGLPFLRVKPGQDLLYNRASTSNPLPENGMLYPWAAYRNIANTALDSQGAIASWEHLREFATAYKRLENTSASRTGSVDSFSAYNAGTSSKEIYEFIHRNRVMPVVARVQWIFSNWAAPASTVAGKPAPPPGSFEPRLLLTPVVTIWNPYNVELTSPALNFGIPRPIPTSLRYEIRANGSTTTTAFRPLTGKWGHGLINSAIKPMADSYGFVYDILQPFTLQPGECRIFSPANGQLVKADMRLTLEPGYRNGSGHYIPLTNTLGVPMALPPDATIRPIARFNTEFYEVGSSGPSGVGVYLDVSVANKPQLAYRMTYLKSVAEKLWPQINDLAESDSLSLLRENPTPFMFTLFGARMASNTQIPAKGFVQSSPLSNFTSMGTRNNGSTYMADYLGSDHPVNSPFDYSFESLTPFDSMIPKAGDASNRGYIITGFNKDTGLSRCVVAEIPTRPLQSLAELTHWEVRYENPVPPFSFNIVANSDASPLLPSNAVVNSNVADLPVNYQHDDSYCANHLLFDDWFFSSLAPDPVDFGSGGRDLQSVCNGFISGEFPLGNRAYRPISEDVGLPNPDSFHDTHVNTADSWKTIASRLEVEGMFNVNSTSFTAWRALLGHARGQRVPYQSESGGAVTISLSNKADHAVSRFSIAGSPEAGEPAGAGTFSEANEFTGYRLLDDATIDALAREIVNQVRARGPFLSLSEFINRQLSSGELALAGALQTAINKLAQNSSTSPLGALTDPYLTRPAGVNADHIDPEYQFPEAAVGSSAYGLPGWIRQADILRPLAPVLSARDDTFTIRAYGDSRDTAGKIKARAVCEAVVTRDRSYVDPTDAADSTAGPLSEVNERFGRRFKVLSFRWIDPAEI